MSRKKKGVLEINIHVDAQDEVDTIFKDYYIIKYNDNEDIIITNKFYCFEKGKPASFSKINGDILENWDFSKFQREMERIVNNHKIYFIRITKNNQCRYKYSEY